MMNLGTNLVVHHCVTNVLDRAAELVRVLGAVQEPGDFASLFQRSELSKNIIQFPSRL